MEFVVIGDTKSPMDFALPGCRFLHVDAQHATNFCFAAACPVQSYARKNVGYLLAIAEGTDLIIDTDDDNFPRPAFFAQRPRRAHVPLACATGWLNVYRYFSDANVWPRGLPLNAVKAALPPCEFPIAERSRGWFETHFKALPTGKALLWYLVRELRRPHGSKTSAFSAERPSMIETDD